MYDGQAIVQGVRLSTPGCSTLQGYSGSSVSGYAVHAFAVLGVHDASYGDLRIAPIPTDIVTGVTNVQLMRCSAA